MKLEDFFNAVVGSREGEFKPSPDIVISEEELMEAYNGYSLENGEKKSSKELGGGLIVLFLLNLPMESTEFLSRRAGKMKT